MYYENFLKLYKTIHESISCKVADFFYSKSTQRKIGLSRGTPRALWGDSKGTWALEHLRHSGTRRTHGHSRHLGSRRATRVLEGHLGTALKALEALYLADSFKYKKIHI